MERRRSAITRLDAFPRDESGKRDQSGFDPMMSLAMRGVAEPRRARAQRADRADGSPPTPDSFGCVADSDAHCREVGAYGDAGTQGASAVRIPEDPKRLPNGTA